MKSNYNKKKFKLIKEYPDSPKLGTIIERGYSPNKYSMFPEFWEEIKEEYKIKTFYVKNIGGKGDLHVDLDYIWTETHTNSGLWWRNGKTSAYTTEEILNSEKYGIHSVEKLSTKETFEMNEQVIYGGIKYYIGIILIKNGELRFQLNGLHFLCGLNEITKMKKIFTTEDGVDVVEGDDVYIIHLPLMSDTKIYNYKPTKARKEISEQLSYRKIFANYQKLIEYLKFNTPILSLNDVKTIYPGVNKEHPNTPSHQAEMLKKLVEDKLNK